MAFYAQGISHKPSVRFQELYYLQNETCWALFFLCKLIITITSACARAIAYHGVQMNCLPNKITHAGQNISCQDAVRSMMWKLWQRFSASCSKSLGTIWTSSNPHDKVSACPVHHKGVLKEPPMLQSHIIWEAVVETASLMLYLSTDVLKPFQYCFSLCSVIWVWVMLSSSLFLLLKL